jgi:hypothetical protein
MLRNQRSIALSHRVIGALSAIAFAILVSVAATHLHIGPDADEACPVCAAVAGKLAGPSVIPVAGIAPGIPCWLAVPPRQHSSPLTLAVVLPPSRGPPRNA